MCEFPLNVLNLKLEQYKFHDLNLEQISTRTFSHDLWKYIKCVCEFRPCSEVYGWAEPVWLLSLCPLWAFSAILSAHRPDAPIMTEKGPVSETAKHGYKHTERSPVKHQFTLLLMDPTRHWLPPPHPVGQSLSSRLKLLPFRSALCQLILQTR